MSSINNNNIIIMNSYSYFEKQVKVLECLLKCVGFHHQKLVPGTTHFLN